MYDTNSQIAHRKKTAEYFSQNLPLYVDKYQDAYRHICELRLDLLFKEIPQGRAYSLLDVGCGAGLFTDMFLIRTPRSSSVCVDCSEAMLRATTKDPRKYRVLAEATALPHGPHSFDLVNIDCLMHHLVDTSGYRASVEKISSFLRSVCGMLKPSGTLMVREIYHESVLINGAASRLIYSITSLQFSGRARDVLRRMGMQTAGLGICFLTRKQWGDAVRRAGFEIVRMDHVSWGRRFYPGIDSGDIYLMLRPARSS